MFMHGSINSFTIDVRIPLSTLLTIGYLCLVPFTLPGTIIAQHVTDITTTEALSNSLDSNGEYDPHHHINDMLVDCIQYFYLRPPPVLSQLLRSTDCIAQIPSFFSYICLHESRSKWFSKAFHACLGSKHGVAK